MGNQASSPSSDPQPRRPSSSPSLEDPFRRLQRNFSSEPYEGQAALRNKRLSAIGAQLLAQSMCPLRSFLDSVEGSAQCADCFEGDAPQWIVMDFGCVVCSDCAGAHRGLHGGVRSVALDEWTEDQVKVVRALGGNASINAELEFHVPDTVSKPVKECVTGQDRARYIQAKYMDRKFVKQAGLMPAPPRNRRTELEKMLVRRSFSAAKETLVGVLDLVIEQVENLPKYAFQSRHIMGGFRLLAQLGRYSGETPSSISGRKWSGSKIQLSWDGESSIEFALVTSKSMKKPIARAVLPLKEILTEKGNQEFSCELTLPFGPEEYEISTIGVRVHFMDLRS